MPSFFISHHLIQYFFLFLPQDLKQKPTLRILLHAGKKLCGQEKIDKQKGYPNKEELQGMSSKNLWGYTHSGSVKFLWQTGIRSKQVARS